MEWFSKMPEFKFYFLNIQLESQNQHAALRMKIKRCVLILFLFCLSPFKILAHSDPAHDRSDDDWIEFYLNQSHSKNLNLRITQISEVFLDKPYKSNALGEGIHGYYDQNPLYHFDEFDCETYVDTVIALALADSPGAFKTLINKIRYRKGQVSFFLRNHFTCLDWNQSNQKQGFIKDITEKILDQKGKSIALKAQALIDKGSWFQHIPLENIRLPKTNIDTKQKKLNALHRKGSQEKKIWSEIPYLPITSLINDQGQINEFIIQKIPHAAIIEVIRPNWDLTKTIGTHLNVSHLGFAIWKSNVLYFRQASELESKVTDVKFSNYLKIIQKSPTMKGINLQVVLPHPG